MFTEQRQALEIVGIRDQLSPSTKLSCDEMGVILPDDNDQDAAPIPSIYWNAAGAMYAYLVGHMTVMGYDILGESQLAGSPPIPQWDIPEAQYPSVTLVRCMHPCGGTYGRAGELDERGRHSAVLGAEAAD